MSEQPVEVDKGKGIQLDESDEGVRIETNEDGSDLGVSDSLLDSDYDMTDESIDNDVLFEKYVDGEGDKLEDNEEPLPMTGSMHMPTFSSRRDYQNHLEAYIFFLHQTMAAYQNQNDKNNYKPNSASPQLPIPLLLLLYLFFHFIDSSQQAWNYCLCSTTY